MVGLAVHAAVLAAGETETGVTIHEVTPELDAGPILAQAPVPVDLADDAAALADRVLAAEHQPARGNTRPPGRGPDGRYVTC